MDTVSSSDLAFETSDDDIMSVLPLVVLNFRTCLLFEGQGPWRNGLEIVERPGCTCNTVSNLVNYKLGQCGLVLLRTKQV